MHDGVVPLGIEFLALGVLHRDAHLLQNGAQLVEDHLHALLVDIVLIPRLGHRPLQVVIDLQELGDGVDLGVLVEVLLLPGGALAVVVVLRRQTQVLVVEGRQLSGQGLHLLHLLPGDGKGLLRLRAVLLSHLGGLLLGLLLLLLHGRGIFLLILTHERSSSLGGNSLLFLPNILVRLSAK